MLGVSRTYVWKLIKQLREDGFTIEAVRNRGYRLVKGTKMISKDEIICLNEAGYIGKEIIVLDNVDSTNNYAKRLAEGNNLNGLLIVTDDQRAGKGRLGRTWISRKGDSIAMSLILKPKIPPECVSMLTLIIAVAVAESIGELTGEGERIKIKWPNDILIDGKKVVGILTELSCESMMINHVVIGVGINTECRDFPEEIATKAGSIYGQLGISVDPNLLIATIMSVFEGYYETFLEKKNLLFMLERYNGILVNVGKYVKIMGYDAGQTQTDREKDSDEKGYTAVCNGIDEMGRLLVTGDDGSMKTVISGEVSVRGIDGYV